MYQAEFLLLEFLVKYLACPCESLGYGKSYYALLCTIRLVKPNYPDYFAAMTFAMYSQQECEVTHDVGFELV